MINTFVTLSCTQTKGIPRKYNSPFCSACICFMTLYYLLSSFIKTYFFLLNFPNDFLRRMLISCESFHLSFLYFQPFWNVWALTRSVLNLQCPRRNLTTNLLLTYFLNISKKEEKKHRNEQRRKKKSNIHSHSFCLKKKKMFSSTPPSRIQKIHPPIFFSLFKKWKKRKLIQEDARPFQIKKN